MNGTQHELIEIDLGTHTAFECSVHGPLGVAAHGDTGRSAFLAEHFAPATASR